MIVFKNRGLIDLTVVKSFGVNVKVGDNPVGYFGTGMKYAIAMVLRAGGSIKIFRGVKVHVLSLKTKKVRGEFFEFVCLDGEELGYTTRLGLNWEPWMAFRELYCNAFDEPEGRVFKTSEKVVGEGGYTTIVVDGWDEFNWAFENQSDFFIPKDKKPIWVDGLNDIEVYEGATEGVFYKGILVGKSEHPCQFTYNIVKDVQLTEDRVLKYPWNAVDIICASILGREETPIEIVKKSVKKSDFLESNLPFLNSAVQPSDKFMTCVRELSKNNLTAVGDNAYRVWTLYKGVEETYTVVEPSKLQHNMIRISLDVLFHAGWTDVKEFEIRVVRSLGQGCYGLSANGVSYITERAFAAGQRIVTGTVLEEYLHSSMGFEDNSRDFQNYLIDKCVELSEIT